MGVHQIWIWSPADILSEEQLKPFDWIKVLAMARPKYLHRTDIKYLLVVFYSAVRIWAHHIILIHIRHRRQTYCRPVHHVFVFVSVFFFLNLSLHLSASCHSDGLQGQMSIPFVNQSKPSLVAHQAPLKLQSVWWIAKGSQVCSHLAHLCLTTCSLLALPLRRILFGLHLTFAL